MNRILPIFLLLLASFTALAQLSDPEKEELIVELLTNYVYSVDEGQILDKEGNKVEIGEFQVITISNVDVLVYWIYDAEQSGRLNDVSLIQYEYDIKKKKYKKIQEVQIRAERTTETEISIVEIGEGRHGIEITSGYDTDGDGDEIKYYLFYVDEERRLTSILEHTLRSDSGDGCDGDGLESTLAFSELVNEGFADIQVEETSSTFNHCEETTEESCTKKTRYTYRWDGTKYSQY